MGRLSVGIEQTRQLQSNGIFYLFIFELVSSRGRPAEFTFLNMFGLFFFTEKLGGFLWRLTTRSIRLAENIWIHPVYICFPSLPRPVTASPSPFILHSRRC